MEATIGINQHAWIIILAFGLCVGIHVKWGTDIYYFFFEDFRSDPDRSTRYLDSAVRLTFIQWMSISGLVLGVGRWQLPHNEMYVVSITIGASLFSINYYYYKQRFAKKYRVASRARRKLIVTIYVICVSGILPLGNAIHQADKLSP